VACAQEWAASIDPSARVIERKHDWTFSSTFGGAAFIKNGAADQTEREPDSLTHALSFQPDEQAAIQYALLQPPLPILWASNEILLYEDELHDCGSSRLSVKARVMPDCWFVLLRLYLRVDRVLVRIRDVRVFHAFGADCVVQEVQLREESWDSLRQRGLPDEPSFYVNVDRVAELVPVSRKHTMSVKLNSA
jgi:type 2A phosphatase activator TIP41